MGATTALMIAPRVELRRIPRGTVRFEALHDHFLSIHAGAPVRVACPHSRAVAVRGEISVLPIGTYDECVQDDPSEVVDVHLPAALVRLAAEEMGLDPARAGLSQLVCVRDPHIEHIAWALEAEHRAGSPSGLIYRESLGLALAAHLLTSYSVSTERPSSGLSPRQLTRVIDYITAHLADDVSLTTLARVASVSASHLRVLFKRSTGVSVHQFIIRRRVDRAYALLIASDIPPIQIAHDVGFAHQSHMARCMRRVLGVTPSAVTRSRTALL